MKINIKKWIICLFLFLTCFFILKYLNKNLTEERGVRGLFDIASSTSHVVESVFETSEIIGLDILALATI